LLNAEIHVCLVSAQAAANLLPALDGELRPRKVLLLVSRKMVPRSEALEGVLKEAGIEAERIEVDDEHDFSRIQEVVLDVAERYEKDRVALNVTGGTKLMALAAHSVATTAEWEVFYVDLDTDEAITLGEEQRRKRLNSKLRLPHYLRAYGYSVPGEFRSSWSDSCVVELAQTLVVQTGSLQRAVARLNAIAKRAEDNNRLREGLEPGQLDEYGFEALLRHFETAGVLVLKGNDVEFASEAHRALAKGGWLEQHVFRVVTSLADDLGIRDKAMNLCVTDRDGVKNELDVAFIARNRLFVIECKTGRLEGLRAEKANDALFKLAEICRRVGGLGTRAMLVSYRALEDAEVRLARALGVELVHGSELIRLDEKLKRWVTS